MLGGALAVGGDLVVFGRSQGLFEAVNAENGELLWQVQAGREPSGLLSHFKRAIISGLRDIAGPHGLRFGMTRWSRPVGVGDHDPPLADAPPPAIIGTQWKRPAYGRAGRWRRRPSTIPCIVLVAPDSSS